VAYEPPKLLTVPEFAAAMRVSSVSVYRWIKDKTIACLEVGGVKRIPSFELEPADTEARKREREEWLEWLKNSQ
jgi:excisionase family DNA binding protein